MGLIFLYFISIFLGLVTDSILTAAVGVYLFYSLFTLNQKLISNFIGTHMTGNDPVQSGNMGLLLSGLALLVPFGISFWWTYKKFDIKPIKLQIKPYYYVAIPALLINTLFFLLNFSYLKI